MARLFPFVQFEFTSGIGPVQGSYLVRDHGLEADDLDAELALDPEAPPEIGSADVLVLRATGAQPIQSRFVRSRVKKAGAEDGPKDVPILLATVIRGTRMFATPRDAEQFLKALKASRDLREEWAEDGLRTVNEAIIAYRACAADPYVVEVTRTDPRIVRVGWGEARDVARGGFTDAVTVPPPPPPKLDRGVRLMPVQGTAAVLAGTGSVLESEVLVLRALADLEHDRHRAAAVGLAAAWPLLRAELADAVVSAVARKQEEETIAAAEGLEAIAARARRGPLAPADVDALRDAAEAIGYLVDQWRYAPLGFA